MSTSSGIPTSAPAPTVSAAHGKPPAKKRKLRKGTFSCWECKRRKIRCEIKPRSSGSVCVSCQQHGMDCVSQEIDESAGGTCGGYEEVEERIKYVEGLVSRLVRQGNAQNRPRRRARSTQWAVTSDAAESGETRAAAVVRMRQSWVERAMRPAPTYLFATSEDMLSRRRSLSFHLHSVLPHSHTAALILRHGQAPFDMLRRPRRSPECDAVTTTDTSPEKAPPVLFARRLMQLALCLQQLDTARHYPSTRPDICLNEPMCQAARRYADTARHVSSQDLLVTSVEGLETLMLAARYQINLGDLRSAWLIFRRALGLAKLLGRRESTERTDFLWFRLLYAERSLSLILGAGEVDIRGMGKGLTATAEVESPEEILDRIHTVLSGRIIARNVRMRERRRHRCSGWGDDDEWKETQEIDFELKRAARSVGVEWWAVLNHHTLASDGQAEENFAKLRTQMDHYYLLVLLHQPYLVQRTYRRSPSARPYGQVDNLPLEPSPHALDVTYTYSYSILVANAAAREVLARFPLFRYFRHVPASYRGLEHKAFAASVTLLLAHLDGHCAGRGDVLEHQRPPDLNAVKDGVRCMESLHCEGQDASSRSNATILRRLLEVEVDAAGGTEYFVVNDEGPNLDSVEHYNDEKIVDLSMPYLGTISIVRQRNRMTQYVRLDASSITSASDILANTDGDKSNTAFSSTNDSFKNFEPQPRSLEYSDASLDLYNNDMTQRWTHLDSQDFWLCPGSSLQGVFQDETVEDPRWPKDTNVFGDLGFKGI